MELKKKYENTNSLFNRKELKIDVESDITPSREDAIKFICDNLSCDRESVKINRIDSNFGTRIFTIVADIYNSKEDKEKFSIKRKKEIEAEKRELEAKKVKEEEKKAKEETEKPEESKEKVEEEKSKEEKSEEKPEDKKEEKPEELKENSENKVKEGEDKNE